MVANLDAGGASRLLTTCVTPYVSHPKKPSHADILRLLLVRGADPNHRAADAEPPLALASKTGRVDLVDTLLAAGASVDVFTAAATLDADAVERFIAADPPCASSVDATGLSPLHYCAGSALHAASEPHAERQLAIARSLLDAGADPDLEAFRGIPVTPLVACCTTGGAPELVRLLVESGANPNHPHALRSALRHFKGRRSPDNPVPDALLPCGSAVDARIDENGRTCLHLYSHHEETNAVAWLLAAGASVTAKTDDGRTPLHLAADRNNHTRVVEMLLDAGADPDAVDALGNRPIDYAARNDRRRIRDFLETDRRATE